MQAMSTPMASFSPPTHFSATPSSHSKRHLIHKNFFTLRPKNPPLVLLLSPLKASADNGVGTSGSAATTAVEPPGEQAVPEPPPPAPEKLDNSVGTNGSVAAAAAAVTEELKGVSGFVDPRWVGGTWDLKQFQKNGNTDWDAVIDAGLEEEVRM